MTASLLNGWIVSMRSKETGEEYVSGAQPGEGSVLELIYAGNEAVAVSSGPLSSGTAFQITDTMAELRFHNWEADGILLLSEDTETGDLLIEPSAYSSRAGVRSVRYNFGGLRHDLRAVVPLYQGLEMDFNDPALAGYRAEWPKTWEAGFIIAAAEKGGVWASIQDSEHRFKTLTIGTSFDPRGFGLESDNYGPISDKRSAGGLVWRFNVYTGDWRVPAGRYRDWLWAAYRLEKQEALRPDWLKGLSFAVSWCPTDEKLLEAIAEKVDPNKVLLHLNNWRKFGYDEDYPYFRASGKGRAFVARCREMGFHVMPHCSSMEIDPSLHELRYLDDFSIRSLESGRRLGWSWVNNSASSGVPESDIALTSNKTNKVMIKIHTAFPTWHSILREHIREPVEDMNLENIFIDVTLCLYNSQQSLINNTPTTLGFLKEIRHLQALGRGGRPLYVGGEGLNEIITQGISFAQVHLFNRNESAIQARTGKCDINAFLFGKLTRSMGYSTLSGKTEDSVVNMQSHVDHGAIPTVTVSSAEEIINPNPAVAKMIKLACEM
jgi:hypothetical protein